MSTEVKHGHEPSWSVPVSGEFRVTIVGHYTPVARVRWEGDGLACAGVTEVVWQSDRPIKRRAELLALRTAFRDFYRRTMSELGGNPNPGSPEALDWDGDNVA